MFSMSAKILGDMLAFRVRHTVEAQKLETQ